ncbi:aspartate dehydrogenase [Pseudotabrizicola alkalilacus]|uniref:L-aspartate dehydrogenase n=1 Tax=Pseudotabrizicola alkalilacus TaxID=2305252 RepID=A0A411Z0A4_9RHOB|nr:aspartate dehydrogenase [Pseudotabrizicola alkalilacus]RGP36486.1 aspartate dehydrogenase [Pseudotabrizicola alkalilacus]
MRLVLIGWGAIGSEIARLLAARRSAVQIVAVAVRDAGRDLPFPLITAPTELPAHTPDLVVEVAGRAAVLPWGQAALAAGADFAPASTSAFAEDGALEALLHLARAHNRQILIPPGALGGMDALSAAARLPLAQVTHDITKPALAWAGTEAETLCDLASLTAPHCFFEGPAREAGRRFPQNANVAMITALAGVGPEATIIRMIADPAATGNRHRIVANGDFGRMEITLDNLALPHNPKSSALTALSLVRLIENRATPLVI